MKICCAKKKDKKRYPKDIFFGGQEPRIVFFFFSCHFLCVADEREREKRSRQRGRWGGVSVSREWATDSMVSGQGLFFCSSARKNSQCSRLGPPHLVCACGCSL